MQRKKLKSFYSPILIFTGLVLLFWVVGSVMFVMRVDIYPLSLFRDRLSPPHSAPRHARFEQSSLPSAKLSGHLGKVKMSQQEHNRIRTQEEAAKELIERAVGATGASMFEVQLEPHTDEFFEIMDAADGKVLLKGSSGVAVASALNWYLRYNCNVDTSWYSRFPLSLPSTLPRVENIIRKESLVQWSYYENVCTFSYTQAWWSWERWEREIDWMAMNGINLPLSLTGQEYVMQRVFQRFGLRDEDIQTYFTGPGFLAWNRMINIKGWAGPLPQSFIEGQMELQKKILARERSLGMTPVLPAFSGGVPDALAQLFPKARFHRHGNWGGFDQRYCCVLTVSPEDALFRELGKAFVEEVIATYGTGHIYSADTFNENRPGAGSGQSSLDYLHASSKAVYESMVAADPEAVWLMQGWLFMNDARFWQAAELDAYLSGVPMGRMIILDLFTDVFPVWKRRDLQRPTPIESRPWIWNMLHSFGGNTGMYGRIQVVAGDPVAAKAQSQDMVGIGITTEGIEQNPIMYELVAEMRWHREPVQPDAWARQWALRRLGPAAAAVAQQRGAAEEAWGVLAQTAYSCPGTQMGQVKSMMECRPRLDLHTGYIRHSDFMPVRRHYPDASLVRAWQLLLQSQGITDSRGGRKQAMQDKARATSAALYDLVDVTRQVLSDLFARLYVQLSGYLQHHHRPLFASASAGGGWGAPAALPAGPLKSVAEARERARLLEGLIVDADRLVGTQEWLLLGRWIGNARAWGATDAERTLMEFNARNLVTLWGPQGEIADYASKQWNGLLADYYLPRWALFFEWVFAAIEAGQPLDERAFMGALLRQEQAWQSRTEPVFPAEPVGDAWDVVAELWAKYEGLVRETAQEDVYVAVAAPVVHAPGADVLSDTGSEESNIRAGVARPDDR